MVMAGERPLAHIQPGAPARQASAARCAVLVVDNEESDRELMLTLAAAAGL